MKRAALRYAILLALSLLPISLAAVPAFASGRKFENVVSRIEWQFSIRRTHVPMMGFVSFCSTVFTLGGVRHMQLAQFDSVGPGVTPEAVDAALRRDLGKPWRRFLMDRERDTGETTFVYAHFAGGDLSLFVADLEKGSLSLIQLRLNEKRMAAWVQNPQGTLKRTGYGR